MISLSFQSFEKGWVEEMAAVLGKAPPPAIQPQEVSPGGGGGGWTQREGWERCDPPGFLLESELKRQNKIEPNSSRHCCS